MEEYEAFIAGFDSWMKSLEWLTLSTAFPLISVILYLTASDRVTSWIRSTYKLEPKGQFIKTLTVCQSGFLAVYSLWTFYNVTNILVNYFLQHRDDNDLLYTMLCDTKEKLWNGPSEAKISASLKFWVSHFYLSKYIEFMDTWIKQLKNEKPIFLQVYHHAGIVLLMWGFVITKNTGPGGVVTCLNSFVHTIMYTYYTAAAFGYRSPLKKYLTQIQLIQFFTGVGITALEYFKESCLTSEQRYSLIGIHLYTVYLIILFTDFYQSNYKSTTNGEAEKANASSKVNKTK